MSKTCTACESAATDNCALCRAALCDDHVHTGQPFITARQLVTTTASTAVRAPRLLGDILLKELDPVGYCAACRQEIAVKRQTEQMKFLLSVLLVVALVVGVPLYVMLAG